MINPHRVKSMEAIHIDWSIGCRVTPEQPVDVGYYAEPQHLIDIWIIIVSQE